MECIECGKEIAGNGIKCTTCAGALHRECGKKVLGKWYCKRCYKQAKKEAKYELMARKEYLSKKFPKKLW